MGKKQKAKEKTYTRRKVLGGMAGIAAVGAAGGGILQLRSMMRKWSGMPNTERLPALFVGHGTPMSGIQPNQWTQTWTELGQKLPEPAAILSISAHWLTQGGALVTTSEKPPMNYDMYGFPPELYRITYPAPGNVALANDIAGALGSKLSVKGDTQWGFDHATWVVLKYMFPKVVYWNWRPS